MSRDELVELYTAFVAPAVLRNLRPLGVLCDPERRKLMVKATVDLAGELADEVLARRTQEPA